MLSCIYLVLFIFWNAFPLFFFAEIPWSRVYLSWLLCSFTEIQSNCTGCLFLDRFFFFNFCGDNSISHLANMLINKVMEIPHLPKNKCYNTLESQQLTLFILCWSHQYLLQDICVDIFFISSLDSHESNCKHFKAHFDLLFTVHLYPSLGTLRFKFYRFKIFDLFFNYFSIV